MKRLYLLTIIILILLVITGCGLKKIEDGDSNDNDISGQPQGDGI